MMNGRVEGMREEGTTMKGREEGMRAGTMMKGREDRCF